MNIIKRAISFIKLKKDPVAYARSLGVRIGRSARLINIKPMDGTFGSEPYLVTLGDHVTVAANVRFFTHDGGVWVFREKVPDIDVFGKIVIGDNVFIGYGSVIMPGVTIGDNVVIGACSIVTRDIPSMSVAVGVPAKVIKSYDEYYQSISRTKMNIRNLSYEEKRSILERQFYK